MLKVTLNSNQPTFNFWNEIKLFNNTFIFEGHDIAFLCWECQPTYYTIPYYLIVQGWLLQLAVGQSTQDWHTMCLRMWDGDMITVSRMPLHVLWVAQGTTTTDSCIYFTLSCTGLMWQIESRTVSVWQCTSVCIAWRQIICLSYACLSLKWMNNSISIPSAATYSSCQASRQTLWSSCLYCGWPDDMERVLRLFDLSIDSFQWTLETCVFEQYSDRQFSALEALRLCTIWIDIYNFTFTLTEQELGCRQQIARKLRTRYAEGIYRHKYYAVTLKSRLIVTGNGTIG